MASVHLLNVVLALGCAGVGAAVWTGWAAPERREAPAPAAPAAEVAVAEGYAPAPLRAFAAIVERPLFAATRRPAADASPTGRVAPPEMSLQGVVVMGDERRALVRMADRAEGRQLLVGDLVDGWRVERIEDGGIVLRRGDASVAVALEHGAPPPDRRRRTIAPPQAETPAARIENEEETEPKQASGG